MVLVFFVKPDEGNKDKDFWKKLEYALEHGMIFQNVCMRLPVSFFSLIFAGNLKIRSYPSGKEVHLRNSSLNPFLSYWTHVYDI